MNDLRAAEGDLRRALKPLEAKTPFAEILAERTIGETLRLDSRSANPRVTSRLQGAVLRAWGGSRWVESATSSLDGPALSAASAAAGDELARLAPTSPPPGVSSTTRGEWSTDTSRPMRTMGSEEVLKLGKDVLGWALAVPGIRDGHVLIDWSDNERLYLNTASSRCYQKLSRVHGSVAPVAIENGKVEFDFQTGGGLGGRERLAFLNEANVRELATEATKLLHAKAPPTGKMPVLLDPGVSGLFAHESFGHGTEADQFVRDRSYLKPILGQEVGPDCLTIVDNGAYPGGWGTIYYDDEGHPGQRTVLIDKGRFVGALHDRETAAVLGAKPTGNTRRSDFLSRAWVRMTNTYVEPADWRLDELLEEMKDGIVLEHGTSGIEDPQGGQMQFKVKKGHRVEKGEVTELVTSMALSGGVLDFLRSIRGVGDREGFQIDTGYCGKGHSDMLATGTGGPYLLSSAVVGPG